MGAEAMSATPNAWEQILLECMDLMLAWADEQSAMLRTAERARLRQMDRKWRQEADEAMNGEYRRGLARRHSPLWYTGAREEE